MCCHHAMSRRTFMGASALGAAAGMGVFAQTPEGPAWPPELWSPDKPYRTPAKPLRVQPVLMYRLPTPREKSSWKSWGGVQTAEAVREESARITGELTGLAGRVAFPMEVLPVIEVTSRAEAARIKEAGADTVIVYPATGSGDMLRACIPDQGGLVFVRHRSGPVYYWYEALSTRYLHKRDDANAADASTPLSVQDVVVDDLDELAWRLRALYAVHNFLGTRIVALGGPWGKYAGEAPEFARERFGFEIFDVPYDEAAPRIKGLLEDAARVKLAEAWTDTFLAMPGTTLATKREFVVNAFLLYGFFKDLMQEHNASAFTIKDCMGVILPMAETTACLTLGLLNDEGLLAFCESDFVVIPAGILLHHVAGTPVFMHNSTFPHGGVVTCAHCASPRRFDGARYEPMLVTTHYESEYGAAPKVDMPIGQEVTFIDPEYASGRWLGMRGTVEDNPNLEICRSQQDVRIHGDWKRLLDEVRDSHWAMVYGDCLKEAGYAARRAGIAWDEIADEA